MWIIMCRQIHGNFLISPELAKENPEQFASRLAVVIDDQIKTGVNRLQLAIAILFRHIFILKRHKTRKEKCTSQSDPTILTRTGSRPVCNNQTNEIAFYCSSGTIPEAAGHSLPKSVRIITMKANECPNPVKLSYSMLSNKMKNHPRFHLLVGSVRKPKPRQRKRPPFYCCSSEMASATGIVSNLMFIFLRSVGPIAGDYQHWPGERFGPGNYRKWGTHGPIAVALQLSTRIPAEEVGIVFGVTLLVCGEFTLGCAPTTRTDEVRTIIEWFLEIYSGMIRLEWSCESAGKSVFCFTRPKRRNQIIAEKYGYDLT